MESTKLPTIQINEKAAARVGRGHLWVFANEVKSTDSAVRDIDLVTVRSEKGKLLGSAFFNRHALIQARLYAFRAEAFTDDLLQARLKDAFQRRQHYLPQRATHRLVYGESDLLPGLIIDRYEDVLVVQFLTAAMDARRESVIAMLRELFHPEVIVERSDVPARIHEGLDERKGVLYGELPEAVTVDLHGLRFGVDVLEGQETGLYLDRVENWRLMDSLAPGRKVVDLFSYAGGFALRARQAGASFVRAVDGSGEALSKVLFNAARNEIEEIKAKQSDVFNYVRALPDHFDLIVCDPPPFARSRKQRDGALRSYRELNRHCLKMLSPGGIMVTCSCSAAIGDADFDKMLSLAAGDASRPVRLLPGGGQPPDHAPLLAMPETRYLKVRIVEAVD